MILDDKIVPNGNHMQHMNMNGHEEFDSSQMLLSHTPRKTGIEYKLWDNKTRDVLYGSQITNDIRKREEMAEVLRKLGMICEKLKSLDEEDVIKSEWRIAAMTIDRCLLFAFALVIALTLVGCFANAPGYVP